MPAHTTMAVSHFIRRLMEAPSSSPEWAGILARRSLPVPSPLTLDIGFGPWAAWVHLWAETSEVASGSGCGWPQFSPGGTMHGAGASDAERTRGAPDRNDWRWPQCLPGWLVGRAWPPISLLAARRAERTPRDSADLGPGLVGALKGPALVHGGRRREVEVALAVHREGEGHGGAVFGGVEGDLVTGDRVGGVLAEAAAVHLSVPQLHRVHMWELVDFGVSDLARVLLGQQVAVGAVQVGRCRARACGRLLGRLAGAADRDGQRRLRRRGPLQRLDPFDERLGLRVPL